MDAVGTTSGFAWPKPEGSLPGAWVTPPADGTATGVVVQRVRDLPHWVEDELWEVELRGGVRELSARLLVDEARLVRKVSEWNDVAGTRFALACIARLQTRAAHVFE